MNRFITLLLLLSLPLNAQENIFSNGFENTPPVVISSPVTEGSTEIAYTYDVDAIDADGDALAYYLLISPSGMEMDIVTGEINWTPSKSGSFSVSVEVSDSEGGYAAQSWSITVLPPDPATMAPLIPNGTVSIISDETRFLYTGPSPIQTGVAPGTIERRRAAVLRGRVTDRSGTPTSGVTVSIHARPEYGQTLTRADGMFDLAVNGGGILTLNYSKQGLLTVQRQMKTPWLEFVIAPDVVMIPLSSEMTTVQMGAVSSQIVVGGMQTDSRGARQSVLLFPAGTDANMTLADGSVQALSSADIRITEYTVGESGPAAMPGELPPASAYTYAAEISIDAALAAGATRVDFNQTIYNYVDNFLAFPVGTIVPVGYYDSQKVAWVGTPNGLTIGIVGVTAGLADIDIDGDSVADTGEALSNIGMTDTERSALAQKYQDNDSLWRVPLNHLTPGDYNQPGALPADARGHGGGLPRTKREKYDPDCDESGSIIGCIDQTLGEQISLQGTGLSLNYKSNRASSEAGRTLFIPLSGSTLPVSLKSIKLEIDIAGQAFRKEFAAEENISYTHVWDGRNAYGRQSAGFTKAQVRIGFVYDAIYQMPADQTISFGKASETNDAISASIDGTEHTLWKHYAVGLGEWPKQHGIANWTLNAHHLYDPNGRILHYGNGQSRSAAGIGSTIELFDSELVPAQFVFDENGDLYYVFRNSTSTSFGSSVVRREPDGTKTIVAGVSYGEYADGVLATEARMEPVDIAFGPDGSLFVADRDKDRAFLRIRQIGLDGIIRTVAGGGSVKGSASDGGLATDAYIQSNLTPRPSIVVAPDGGFYFRESSGFGIRYVSPDGIIQTIYDGYSRANILLGDDGFIYFCHEFFISKISPNGEIIRVAGDGASGTASPDGIPAIEAHLRYPEFIEFDANGNLLIVTDKILSVDAETGLIWTVAGTSGEYLYSGPWSGQPGSDTGDGGPALKARWTILEALAVHPQGHIYFSSFGNSYSRNGKGTRVIKPALDGVGAAKIVIPSEDGGSLFQFDPAGRHLSTINAQSGTELMKFGYDDEGLLVLVTDAYGNQLDIERDATGAPTAIVAAGGQRSLLTVDENGYLESVSNAATETVGLIHDDIGLLTQMTDPLGNVHRYTYDAADYLIRDENSAGGIMTLLRAEGDQQETVTLTTALGRSTVYQREYTAINAGKTSITLPGGAQTIVESLPDGSSVTHYANGGIVSQQFSGNPRFGMGTPMVTETTITTPGGLTQTISQSRSVTLSDPDDIASLLQMETTTLVNGREHKTVYDTATGSFTKTFPSGWQIRSELDSMGNIVSVTEDGGLPPRETTFDTLGRRSSITLGDQSVTFEYDAANRVISKTDALGRTVLLDHDNGDRLTQVTRGGLVTQYGYDSSGQRTTVTMPEGQIHSLAYTSEYLVSAYTTPDEGVFSRAYDLDGNLVNRTLPSGRVISNTFDSANRWSATSYPEADVIYGFADTTDRLSTTTRTATADGKSQTISYSYDASLVLSSSFSGTANGDFAYSYDNDFAVTDILLTSGTYSVSRQIAYDIDGLTSSYGTYDFTRGGPRRASTAISDGVLDLGLGYDSMARFQNKSLSVASTTLFEMALEYDIVGRISAKLETIDGVTRRYDYQYDAAGRLIEVLADDVSIEQFSYDKNSNMVNLSGTAASYDDQDRITTLASINYTFDSDGFLTQRGAYGFVYSSLGELLSVSLTDDSTVSYGYDGFGRRISRTNAAGTTQYLYGNPGNFFLVTAVRDNNGVLTVYDYDEASLLFAMERAGSTYYIATDQIGSPRVISDTSGNIVKSLEYSVYGQLINDSAPAFDMPFGYAGGLEDRDTGLIRFGFRDYDQASARWMARDPALYGGGQTNLYSYVGSDPVGHRDPTGLWCVGGSLYNGPGGGASACCQGASCSFCGEFGAGRGGGLNIDPTGKPEASDDGHGGVEIDTGVGCGPVSSDMNCKFSKRCPTVCKPTLSIPLVSTDLQSGKIAPSWKDGGVFSALVDSFLDRKTSLGKCGLSAVLKYKNCEQFSPSNFIP